MAVFYPQLFCEKGSILEAKIKFELDNFIINIGEKCFVKDIVGYGYDILKIEDTSLTFRILNSNMSKYFNILLEPEKEEMIIDNPEYKVKFIKKLENKDFNDIQVGQEFYYTIDRTNNIYYNLFDEYRKVVRLNENEAIEYLKFIEL